MSTSYPLPSSQNLCGTFTAPATPDAGRSYSAPIVTNCAAPSGITVDGEGETTYVDGDVEFSEV